MDESSSTIDPYEAHAGQFHFTSDDVVKRTKLPSNGNIPHVLGWSGPARSGTTSMLLLLAGHPQVDRVYFQPQKTILRKGEPEFELYSEDRLICMKEVYGFQEGENYDPIDMLLRAGIPPEKITWITLLRDPLFSFASWRHIYPSDPEVFANTQVYTIEQFFKYRRMGIKMIPFVYDLLKDNERHAVRALLEAAGLTSSGVNLNFDTDQIDKKLVKGQAAEKEYFDFNIRDTYQRHKYIYSNNNYVVPPQLAQKIDELCRLPYNEFLDLAKDELHL